MITLHIELSCSLFATPLLADTIDDRRKPSVEIGEAQVVNKLEPTKFRRALTAQIDGMIAKGNFSKNDSKRYILLACVGCKIAEHAWFHAEKGRTLLFSSVIPPHSDREFDVPSSTPLLNVK